MCRGNTGLIPVSFFLLGCGIASLGPGNISTAAMLAPMAMAVAGRARIPPFLMAIMVGNGAGSGALSPFAPTGIIVNGLMERIELGGFEWCHILDESRRACRGCLRRLPALRRVAVISV